jgi:hypothetical protein
MQCSKCKLERFHEFTGFFNSAGQFVRSDKQRWYIRTECSQCKQFMGFRPVAKKERKTKS